MIYLIVKKNLKKYEKGNIFTYNKKRGILSIENLNTIKMLKI